MGGDARCGAARVRCSYVRSPPPPLEEAVWVSCEFSHCGLLASLSLFFSLCLCFSLSLSLFFSFSFSLSPSRWQTRACIQRERRRLHFSMTPFPPGERGSADLNRCSSRTCSTSPGARLALDHSREFARFLYFLMEVLCFGEESFSLRASDALGFFFISF